MRITFLNWLKYPLRPVRMGIIAVLVILIWLFASPPPPQFPQAQPSTLSGILLAAEFAATHNDIEASAQYYAAAHALQPTDAVLTEKLFQAYLATAQMDKAHELTELLLEQTPTHRMARLLRIVENMRKNQYKAVFTELDAFADDSFSALLAKLTTMWTHYGAGDIEAAREVAQALDKHRIFRLYVMQNTALFFEAIGDKEAAQDAFAKAIDAGGMNSAHFVMTYIDFLHRTGETKKALMILAEHRPDNFYQSAFDIAVQEFTTATTPPAPLVLQARQGMAAAMLGFAILFNNELANKDIAPYAHIALWLDADLDNAHILLGGLAARVENFTIAKGHYTKVPQHSRYHIVAGLANASAHEQAGDIDEAIALLKTLDAQYQYDTITSLLADVYRRAKYFAEAEKHYTKLIESITHPKDTHWKLFFARGEVRERQGDWPRAEADLLKAKTLSDENAYVLNYLGYSWVDHGENLQEGLEMIKAAVAQQPRNGFFVDSLGWAYYRLAQYQLAVVFLEKATEFVPDDPEIISHLGDALWQVGRKIEARYQWQRVLRLDIESEMREAVERKIDKGVVDNPPNPGPII